MKRHYEWNGAHRYTVHMIHWGKCVILDNYYDEIIFRGTLEECNKQADNLVDTDPYLY